MKIFEPNQITKDPFLKMFLYGPPGEGKTFFSLNHSLRTAYVCTEWEQARVTWQVLAERGVVNPDSRVFQVETMEDLRESIRYILDRQNAFDIIVLDNLTDVQEFIKNELLAGDKKRDMNVLTIGEWQILVDKTVAIIKAFRDIPDTHFVCIGHFGELFDDRQQRFIRPSVLGKSLPARLSATMSLVGYLHSEVLPDGLRREIVFAGASNILTKPHSMLRNIEYANLEFLLAKMAGKLPRNASYSDWRAAAGSSSRSMAPLELFVEPTPETHSTAQSQEVQSTDTDATDNQKLKTQRSKTTKTGSKF